MNEKWEKARRFSHVGMSSSNNFTYAIQYLRAYEVLYKSDEPVDTIALPMLYVMRHYLELALKYNVAYLSEFSGSTNMAGNSGNSGNSSHSLSKLSNAFHDHWVNTKAKYGINVDDRELVSDFNQLIQKLEQIDQFAISFRFSHNREQAKNFEWSDTIDIHALNQLFENAQILLNPTIDVFEDCTGLMDNSVTKEELIAQN
ncbi:hypothetical protein [Vibrio sp. SCSIO 43169]|uniref:hypothetical protein n=1 Tax=Vibrio sp. SCSIO 43169 TaxID=2822801 RepID=UPI0020442C87|nr:hypothetical protein [Vibrio sp. SCSIO 43169]MCM5509603.1 hypothetical protein [Vibrio sp. SCSIO 43169]